MLDTSEESGDCGQVGRGNKINDVVSLNRPIDTEAAAGKNSVGRVGKSTLCRRLIKSWRATNTLPAERMRAAQALVNMGSPRYLAAIKDRLLDASAQQDVAGIARYLDELQRLAASRRPRSGDTCSMVEFYHPVMLRLS